MPLPPITRFSSLATSPSPTNKNNGLYAPPLNAVQIAAIPDNAKLNGGIWYNETTKNLEAVVNNKVEIVQVGPAGQGDVVGPGASVKSNIAIFNDNTGKLIADSGVNITPVPNPALLLRFSNSLQAPNITVNEIGNLGHVKFTDGLGLIFVDGLMPVEFITNSWTSLGKDYSQVCSLFTDGLPSSSTTHSALVEIQSDTGALLLSRMTTTERNALSAPSGANGMLLFNTTSKTYDGFDGTNWRTLPMLNTDGTLSAADPLASTNLATKNYVDTSIALPAAAKFIVQQSNISVPNAQSLGALPTGLLKNTTTTGTGVLSIATAGTDYYSPGNPTRIIDTGVGGNFFIGTGAGNLATIGISNTGAGVNSLALNFAGNYNSAFGAESLYNNANAGAANYNSAFGYRSSYSNNLGLENSSFGAEALASNINGDDNCSFGSFSLYSNLASGNSSFGRGSSQNNVSGSNNCSFGYNTGATQAIYNNCSFFGVQADASANNLTNAVAIGYQASVGASNRMVLGGSGANQLSVGIGLTPNAQLQLPTIHANRKFVLYETGNNDHQVIGVGTATNIFRFQIDNNTISSGYTWNAATSVAASTELMRLTGTGFLGIGTTTPYAPLQFANTIANRKIVLYEDTINNDHQFSGIGINPAVFRFQIGSSASSYIFYTGVTTTTSAELMRLTGTGFLGIGLAAPHAPLQFVGSVANRKIVLYEVTDNDHQFYGFGVNSFTLRYQVPSGTDSHVFYAGASPSTSTELMRITAAGVLYAKQSYATYSALGNSTTTIPAILTYTKLTWPNGTILNNTATNYTVSSSRATYIGTNTINAKISFDITIGIDGGAAAYGEVTGIAIYKNGATKIGEILDLITNTNQPFTSMRISTTSSTITNDYYELWVMHGVTIGRTVTVYNMCFNISST